MFTKLLQSAKRCNAIYIEDDVKMRSAFKDLGHDIKSQYVNNDHKAVISVTDESDKLFLTFSGTRFTTGTTAQQFGDLFDDINIEPLEIEPGVVVPRGPWDGCEEVFQWAENYPSTLPFIIEGHSLGSRSRYARYFLPEARIAQIIAFAAPKFASAAFWAKYWKPGDISCLYHRDLWASWPWDFIRILPWCQPPGQSLLYIEDKNFARISEKEWLGGLNPGDHSINNAYIPALENLSKVYGNGDK